MSAAEKAELQRKQRRFEALTPDEQQRLRELHEQLATAPDGERLRTIALNYYAWQKSLQAIERAELQNPSLPPSERVARVKKLLQKQVETRFKDYAEANLDSEDREQIDRWLRDVVERYPDEFRKIMIPRFHAQYDTADLDQRVSMIRRALFFGANLQHVGLPDEELAKLTDNLSERATTALSKTRNDAERANLVRRWVWAAARARLLEQFHNVPADELMRFYREQLTDQEKRRLEILSPHGFRRELTT